MIEGYMIIGGRKIYNEGRETIEIRSPYDGSLVGTTPSGNESDVISAVAAAEKAFEVMKNITPYERYHMLKKAARLLSEKSADFAKVLVKEVGKTIKEAMGEVSRAVNTMTISAEEARKIIGEEVSFESSPGVKGKTGYYIRVPLGIIGCITPFNFPLNLTCHKVAPALACGNTVVVKPSENTPFAVIMLAELFAEAGFPEGAVNVVTGFGETAGDAIVRNEKISLITFTGSVETGKKIMARGGFKRYTMELGSNSAVYIDEDTASNIDRIVQSVARGGFTLAGQVCISVQRVFAHENIFDIFVDNLCRHAEAMKVGNPQDESTDMGPVINKEAADRIMSWIEEAKSLGGKVACGGKRISDTLIKPTILVDVPLNAKVHTGEVFGPVIVVNKVKNSDEAIENINMSRYGLQAGIFTNNIKTAFRFIKNVDAGGIMINEVPTFRVDHMPYGGVKESGIGREGPHFAIEEMTQIKIICFDIT